jgi:hypothetical protein
VFSSRVGFEQVLDRIGHLSGCLFDSPGNLMRYLIRGRYPSI